MNRVDKGELAKQLLINYGPIGIKKLIKGLATPEAETLAIIESLILTGDVVKLKSDFMGRAVTVYAISDELSKTGPDPVVEFLTLTGPRSMSTIKAYCGRDQAERVDDLVGAGVLAKGQQSIPSAHSAKSKTFTVYGIPRVPQ